MKKLLIIVGLCFFLVGCKEKELTKQELKEQIFNNGIIFKEDNMPDYVNKYSEDYKNLFKLEYDRLLSSVTYNSNTDKFRCNCTNTEDYQNLVQKDIEGFQKDFENMLALGLDQNSIDDYVYSYIRNAIKSCGVVQNEFELELSDTGDSFKSNVVILDIVQRDIDKLYNCSINYKVLESKQEWHMPEEQLALGQGIVLCTSCGGSKTNCFIRLDNIIQGEDAAEYVRGLSSINKDLTFDGEVYVITYTIINLGKEDIIFDDKIVSVDDLGNIITYNSKSIVGLETTKKIEPGIDTTITNLYVGNNSGGLLWYDKICNNVLGINLNQ